MTERNPDAMKATSMCKHGYILGNCDACKIMTAESAPERSPEEQLENVERARRGVEQAVLLDTYLDSPGKHSIEKFLTSYRLQKDDIPEGLYERFTTIIEEWESAARGHKVVQQTLERIAQERFGNIDAEHLGIITFQGILSKQEFNETELPVGKIEVMVKGPFVVIYTHSPVDHDRIGTKDSGGTYHRSKVTQMHYRNEDLLPAILLVNGSPEASYSKQIVAHERQHFINDNWMRKTNLENATALTRSSDRLKDEVLAYLKDGRDPADLTVLKGDLYKNIFATLNPNEALQLNETLDAIINALGNATALFPTKDSRALLVYHLIDTPLQRIPDVVRLLIIYEEQRGNPARNFYDELPPPPDDDEMPHPPDDM